MDYRFLILTVAESNGDTTYGSLSDCLRLCGLIATTFTITSAGREPIRLETVCTSLSYQPRTKLVAGDTFLPRFTFPGIFPVLRVPRYASTPPLM